MDLSHGDLDFLFDQGDALLAGLAQEDASKQARLGLISRLRKTLSPGQCSVLLEQWELQRLNQERSLFRGSPRPWLQRDALQQASHWQVASHRAAQFRERGVEELVEIGSGIGGDSRELAAVCSLVGYELDSVRARLAAHNCPQGEIRWADFWDSHHSGPAVFVDPARRENDQRIFDPERYRPRLSQVVALRQRFPLVCVKAGPGISDEQLPQECEVEFVSHEGVCKEAVLWLSRGARGRRASIFAQGRWWHRRESPLQGPGELKVGGWLHEPDGALLRARALGELAQELDAGWLDPHIGYLVGSRAAHHPLAASFEISEILPLQPKAIQQALKRHRCYPLEIKKRGVSIEPEDFRRHFKLHRGGGPGVLILTRQGDQRMALLARRWVP